MATFNPQYPPGTWVQYNPSATELPNVAECTIGQIKSSFTKSDGPYYQVVWNPGGQLPVTGLYHESQLCCINPSDAQQIRTEMANAGGINEGGQ